MNIQDCLLGIWGLYMVVLSLVRLLCIKVSFFPKEYYWEYFALPEDHP